MLRTATVMIDSDAYRTFNVIVLNAKFDWSLV